MPSGKTHTHMAFFQWSHSRFPAPFFFCLDDWPFFFYHKLTLVINFLVLSRINKYDIDKGLFLYKLYNVTEHELLRSLLFTQALEYFYIKWDSSSTPNHPPHVEDSSILYDKCDNNNYFSSSDRPDSFLLSFWSQPLLSMLVTLWQSTHSCCWRGFLHPVDYFS